jgi:hypothetical protein
VEAVPTMTDSRSKDLGQEETYQGENRQLSVEDKKGNATSRTHFRSRPVELEQHIYNTE